MEFFSKQYETVVRVAEKKNMEIRLENANLCCHGNQKDLENIHFTV